jgi:tRNA threonylcarbamoyladenosine biosynthesis protein TsaB
VPVNTLEALAASFVGFGSVVAPLLDARREQVYCAAYGGALEELLPPCALLLSELLAHPAIAEAPRVLFAGDGAIAFHDTIAGTLGCRAVFAPPHLMLQRAGAAAWLAYKKAMSGMTMDASELLPLYLRKPQAERMRDAREAGNGA